MKARQMTKVPLSTTSQRPFRLPDFHDDYLRGIIVTDTKECVVLIGDQHNNLHHVVLSGVLHARADGFRENNIILDLTVVPADAVTEEALLWTLSMPEAGPYRDFVDSTLQRIKDGELFLVQIASSYGCSFSCLCAEGKVDGQPGRKLIEALVVTKQGKGRKK
jgi:hypothetical protein